ncbi:Hydrogenase large subunit [Candidatus Hydrogenisulfobacillus filiaventi]|uniref:Hydrogenase large subunit n=1 Tax=Candidatus Hydrogenisulfobacillus filiaventi TaxID=2707344 RepID=A0A6F8ZFB8_9FIRM|nr:Hydrogenase large subunit [Candidatus Hydrogenisulfobacillus filiaventi]
MALNRVTIDPITRIEGHLRIEVDLDANNVVRDAYSSSTMFRGIELILKGRDPRDAGLFAQRICGVCTFSHYDRATEAVEAALGVQIPDTARLVRNLLNASLFIHDHVVHFYQLHGMDWFDPVSALQASPAKAAQVAQQYAATPFNAGQGTYEAVQARLKKFVESGQLGPFANGYWGHPAYQLSPEQNLIMLSHYLDALKVQRTLAQAMTVFGGKNPHPQSLVVGGVTSIMDVVDPSRVSEYLFKMKSGADFVENAYMADMRMLGEVYRGEAAAGIGAGVGNYLDYGGFPQDNLGWPRAKDFFPGGVILNRDLNHIAPVDANAITEDVTHAWYAGPDKGVGPFEEETILQYTGLEPDGALNRAGKYSWIKAPRYHGKPMEGGPLARFLIARGLKAEPQASLMNEFEQQVGWKPSYWFSTVGRTAARALEAQALARTVPAWVDELVSNVAHGNTQTYAEWQMKDGDGFALRSAPRGALGHWVKIRNGQIVAYQAVVPSTWNASPRDHLNQRGPYEEALMNTKVAIPDQPVEVLRTIHSFDPCIGCAVHLFDAAGQEIGQFQIDV